MRQQEKGAPWSGCGASAELDKEGAFLEKGLADPLGIHKQPLVVGTERKILHPIHASFVEVDRYKRVLKLDARPGALGKVHMSQETQQTHIAAHGLVAAPYYVHPRSPLIPSCGHIMQTHPLVSHQL